MSKEKNEDITDDIHSESETDELEESNEVSDEERITELEDTILRFCLLYTSDAADDA